MNDMNISQKSDSSYANFSNREVGKAAMGDLLALLQNTLYEVSVKLHEETGLPEIYQPVILKEFVTDPQNAKNLDDFKKIFENSKNLSNSQFKEIFHEFSEDQVIKNGGYLNINEAYEEWPSYLKEREETTLEMKKIAASFNPDEPPSSKEIAGVEPPSSKEVAEAEDPMRFMSLVLEMIIQLTSTLQETAMIQAKQLEVQTQVQDAYLTIQTSLETISPNDASLFKKPGSEEAMDAANYWNVTALPQYQEQNRSYKETSQERSKVINSKINETTTALQRLSDVFSEILGKSSSIFMSINR
jgi:hypothetical protein